MGNSCATVFNESKKHICVMCFNNMDSAYAEYYNNEIFVIPPGGFCNVKAGVSTYGLQVAIITDVHPTEHFYSFDVWWVKTGATLTVTAVDSVSRVVNAHGSDCESCGHDKKLRDSKRLTNLRMCLNIFKYHIGVDLQTPPASAEPHFASAPQIIVDNSHCTTSLTLLDVYESFLGMSGDASGSVTDIVAPFSFHIFSPGAVAAYAYVKLPGHWQIIVPAGWTLPRNLHRSAATKHLRLHNSNRYTFLPDPGGSTSTAVVTSCAGSQFMKMVPLMDSRQLPTLEFYSLRMVLVLNVLLSCFQPDSDPYLVVSPSVSIASPPPPDLAADLSGWFAFCDITGRGSVSLEEVVQGLWRSCGQGLDAHTLSSMRASVEAVWSQVFGGAVDFAPSISALPSLGLKPLHQQQAAALMATITQEVFLEDDGVGFALAQHVVPLFRSLDRLFLQVRAAGVLSVDAAGRSIITLPSGCAITRQHVYDLLTVQQGDEAETALILQQMHPSLAAALSPCVSTLAPAPPTGFSATPSLQATPSVHPPTLEEFSTLAHPAVRVCALAARDIYYCTDGGGCEGSADTSSCHEKIEWQHLSSGDVDTRRNELTRWALWREVWPVSPSFPSSDEPITVLVFRGTSLDHSFQDVLHDAMIQPLRLCLRPGCSTGAASYVHVHAGFNTAIENIFETILSALQSHKVKSFYVTGHSLGAALAQVFGLKYLVQRPAAPLCSSDLLHILTFAAPMVLWYGDDHLSSAAASSELLHPWRSKCLNFMHRADPVPLLPRMLSCKFCWNALVAAATSRTSWIGSFLAQKYIAVPEDGDIPPDSVFRTLKFTRGFVPPGLTAVLLGGGRRVGPEQLWTASVVLPPESMQKLSTSFDTFARSADGFDLHSMSHYVQQCCRDSAAHLACGVDPPL